MGGDRWPALAIQGTFLAANISFLLSGHCDGFILASVTIIMLLFVIQFVSDNPRFMYLFPVYNVNLPWRTSHRIASTASLDTHILRLLIALCIVLFYIGAIRSLSGFKLGYAVIGTLLLISAALAFPRIWHTYIRTRNTNMIGKKLAAVGHTEFDALCLSCRHPARYRFAIEERDTGYQKILTIECSQSGSRTILDEPLV